MKNIMKNYVHHLDHVSTRGSCFARGFLSSWQIKSKKGVIFKIIKSVKHEVHPKTCTFTVFPFFEFKSNSSVVFLFF